MFFSYHLSCHCHQVALDLQVPKALSTYTPRACDCSFCQERRAEYLSDPAGHLSIRSQEPLQHQRQGSEQAEFLSCASCADLVAVVFQSQDGLRGALNIALARDSTLAAEIELAAAQTASPQLLNAEQKRERWLALWFKVDVNYLKS